MLRVAKFTAETFLFENTSGIKPQDLKYTKRKRPSNNLKSCTDRGFQNYCTQNPYSVNGKGIKLLLLRGSDFLRRQRVLKFHGAILGDTSVPLRDLQSECLCCKVHVPSKYVEKRELL